MRRALVVLVGACATAPPAPPKPPPPPPKVRIEIVAQACVDVPAVTARIEQLLAKLHATYADMAIRVDASTVADATQLQLRITRTSSGHVGLDRTYSLGPSDCASAGDLLALGVDRFLDAFPDWAGPAPPPKPIAPPPSRWIDVAVMGAASTIFEPVGVDAHLGGAIDFGASRHRFGGTMLVRGSVPQSVGKGSFQQTAMLAGAAYRFRSDPWRVRAEVRGGALLVSGLGLEDNNSDWLPWWEGAVFVGRGFSWGALGVEVAASGLRHKAVTSDGLVSEDIPLLRLGVAGEFGLWTSK
jgi:hypothetical protein